MYGIIRVLKIGEFGVKRNSARICINTRGLYTILKDRRHKVNDTFHGPKIG